MDTSIKNNAASILGNLKIDIIGNNKEQNEAVAQRILERLAIEEDIEDTKRAKLFAKEKAYDDFLKKITPAYRVRLDYNIELTTISKRISTICKGMAKGKYSLKLLKEIEDLISKYSIGIDKLILAKDSLSESDKQSKDFEDIENDLIQYREVAESLSTVMQSPLINDVKTKLAL